MQHTPVYTVGKRGSAGDFKLSPDALARLGVQVHASPRGGETTFHGPGQLVAYPIVNLRARRLGARAYVEGLEDALIETLARFDVHARVRARARPRPCGGCPAWPLRKACSASLHCHTHTHTRARARPSIGSHASRPQGRVPGATGVYVGERKIGAIGVRISQGVASHGVALNVCTDLAWFSHIVPCGAPDRQATSLALESPASRGESTPATAAPVFVDAFAAQFGYTDVQELGSELP